MGVSFRTTCIQTCFGITCAAGLKNDFSRYFQWNANAHKKISCDAVILIRALLQFIYRLQTYRLYFVVVPFFLITGNNCIFDPRQKSIQVDT